MLFVSFKLLHDLNDDDVVDEADDEREDGDEREGGFLLASFRG